jgi:hypothetical protein
MTLQEELVAKSLFLDRYKPSTLDEIETKLLLAQKQILELISSTTNKKVIKTEINKIFEESFSTFDTVLNDDISQIQELAWNSTQQILSSWVVADKVTKFKDIADATAKRLASKNNLIQGFTLDEHLASLKATQKNKIRGLIYSGFDSNIGIDEINRNIKNSIGGLNRNTMRTLVRTSIFEATELARNEAMEDLISDLDEPLWEYTSVFDSRRTLYCTNAQGYQIKDRSKAKYNPKSHYNCRSLWVITTKQSRAFDKKYPPKRNFVQWKGKKVNHRDGTTSTKFKIAKVKKVSADITPQQFFDNFDEKYKINYMGDKRYELYKSGNLKFKDMLNTTKDKFLTIEQLNKKLS